MGGGGDRLGDPQPHGWIREGAGGIPALPAGGYPHPGESPAPGWAGRGAVPAPGGAAKADIVPLHTHQVLAPRPPPQPGVLRPCFGWEGGGALLVISP